MSNPAHIYFYGDDKILSLKKNNVLLNVFEIFPITKLTLKRILDHKHQWISDSAYFVPDSHKNDWVSTVTLCILTIGIVSSYRAAYAEKYSLSLNDSEVTEAVNNLLPEDILQSYDNLSLLKQNLLKVLPELLKDYLEQNFGAQPNIVTNGVVELFLTNSDSLHLQLTQDEQVNNLSLLRFDSVSSLNGQIKNYLLVSIKENNCKLKIDFTNSKDHSKLLSRFVATLISDSSFKISKSFIDEDEQAELYTFETIKDFISLYNSLLLEVKLAIDHSTFLEIVNEYGSINPSLRALNSNLEIQLSSAIESFKESQDITKYFNSREGLINYVHLALKASSFEVNQLKLIDNLDELIKDCKNVSFNDLDNFKQINFIKSL